MKILIAISILSGQFAFAEVFGIQKILSKNHVAIVGWAHVDGNPVPDMLAKELPTDQTDLVLLTEDSYGYPLYQTAGFPGIQRLVEAAESRGIQVSGADHPGIYEHGQRIQQIMNDPAQPQLIRVLSAFELPKLTVAQRDHHMAEVIEAFLNVGKKVVMIVGANHIPGIAAQLKNRNIAFTARAANTDIATGAIYLEDKFIGQQQETPQLRFSRAWDQMQGGRGLTPISSVTWAPQTSIGFKGKLNEAAQRCMAILLARPAPQDQVNRFSEADL